MAAIPPLVLAAAIGAVGAVGAAAVTGAMAPKAPKPLVPAAQISSRSAAMDRADMNDVLSRRQGTNADRRVAGGFGAGEAATGPTRSLLGRN